MSGCRRARVRGSVFDFDLIRQNVTARQAAERYGLKFGRNGRALCPWHDDHTPDLRFYDESATCFCFACHAGGDAVALTAQLFGLSMADAARKVVSDFRLDIPADAPRPVGPTAAELRRSELQREEERWTFLCDVVREADERLRRVTPENIPDDFDAIVAARARADLELEQMWEETRNVRNKVTTRPIHGGKEPATRAGSSDRYRS